MKILIALGVTGFVLIYFVLVPYLLWTAPNMDEEEEEREEHEEGQHSSVTNDLP